MNKLAKLKQARAAKILAAKQILDAAKAANRDLSDDETSQVTALTDEATTLKGQIATAEAQAALHSEIEADAAALEQPAQRRAGPSSVRIEGVREASEADPKCGFRSPRDYLTAVMKAGESGQVDKRLAPLTVRKQAAVGSDEQGEYSDSYGGFLLPQGFRPEMLTVSAEGDPTVGRTTRIPMNTVSVKIPARTDKNHTTSVTGGLRFYRRQETDTSATSRMEVEQIDLRANPLMGVAFATEELLADSPISFAAIIQNGFATELGSQILDEKIRGTGAGQYQGVLNCPAKVSITKEGGQAASTVVYNNVLKMRARCWGFSNAIWLANHDTFPQLAVMSLPVGTGGVPVYIPSAQDDRPDMLLGRPIFYTEYAETLGTEGDLILANWSQYLEGELQGMEMADSIHVRFVNNERAFRVTARNDGRPWWRSALTPRKGTNTLSPFVTLATRA
jgi:HK97 family phage major capsid protein